MGDLWVARSEPECEHSFVAKLVPLTRDERSDQTSSGNAGRLNVPPSTGKKINDGRNQVPDSVAITSKEDAYFVSLRITRPSVIVELVPRWVCSVALKANEPRPPHSDSTKSRQIVEGGKCSV